MTLIEKLRRAFAGRDTARAAVKRISTRNRRRRPVRQRITVIESRRPPATFSPPPKRRIHFFLRPRPDGVPDILDAIQELGGIASPSQSRRADKGDYDGFREAFRGPARVLIRRTGGRMPDLLVEALTNVGSGIGQTFRLESTSDLYDAVERAVKERAAAVKQSRRDRIDAEFFSAATDARCDLNTQVLTVGDRFKIKRDDCRVRDVDPDTDDVEVDCEPKYGRQRLPDNSPFSPAECRVLKGNPAGFFDAPESVAEQKKRLADEAAQREKAGQREEIRRRAAARITGRSVDTTGDLFDTGGADAPLFALRKAFSK